MRVNRDLRMFEQVVELTRALRTVLDRTERRRVARYVALSLASALAGSMGAVLLVPLLHPGQPLHFAIGTYRVLPNLAWAAGMFAAVSAGFALLRWRAARLAADLPARYARHLRCLVHERLLDAALGELPGAQSAEIANVLTHNVEIMTQGFSALLQLLVAAATTLVSLLFALLVSPLLVMAAPLVLAIGLWLSRTHAREQSQVSRRYVADITRLFWLSEDFPRRLRHIRSFRREPAELSLGQGIAASLERGYRRQLELVASGRLVLELLAAIGIAGVVLMAHFWHGVDRSALLAVGLLLGRLLPYLVSTRQSLQHLRSALPALQLWQRYMRVPVRGLVPPVQGLGGRPLLVEHLRICQPVAVEIRALRLLAGQLTLISGDSGVGKSTLLDVLAGMVEPDRFSASLDGQAIDFRSYVAYMQGAVYVAQNVRPWQRTVRDCLQWAAPGASEQAMDEALAVVGLRPRLAAGDGLDTLLDGAAGRLSGGETQRLLLAQVVLRQPAVAFLDETTGALDAASELSVLALLKRRLPDTALVVVSHREGVSALAEHRLILGARPGVVAA